MEGQQMNERKYVLMALLVTALGVVPVCFSGPAHAQGMGSGGGMMGGGGAMMGASGGMSWPDTLQEVTVSGVVLVEAGYVHDLYALDTNADGIADYRLGFGPWWYEPASGAVRPGNGAPVTIKGGLSPVPGDARVLLVFEINGLGWREPGELLPWSGGWMHGAADTTFFQAPTDSLSWMGFPSAVMGDMMERMMGTVGGTVVADSVYIHFEALGPDRLPGPVDGAMMAGYHVGLADPWGNDLMGDAMGMDFSRGIQMRLHYDIGTIEARGYPANELALKALDADGVWVEVPDALVDPVAGTVSLDTQRVFAYYALFTTAPVPTAVETSSWGEIKKGMER
jgi:hypothetical protein